jgi:hypothetical protein
VDDSIFNFVAPLINADELAKVTLGAQNTSYATKVIEKQKILTFKEFQV